MYRGLHAPFRVVALVVALCCSSAARGLAQAATPPIIPKFTEPAMQPRVELPPPAVWPADVPNRPLTAQEAAEIALHLQPTIAQARAGILNAQGVEQELRSELKPTVITGVGYNNVNTTARTSTTRSTPPTSPPVDRPFQAPGGSTSAGGSNLTPGFRISATVQQLIYDFDHTRDLVRQAGKERQSAQGNLTRVQSDLVLQVKEAFYGYLQNRRLVLVSESNLYNQRESLLLAKARANAGVGLPADVVRAETAVADALYSLTQARTNAAEARVGLAEVIGIDPRTPLEVSEVPEPPPATDDVTALVQQGLQDRPETRLAETDIEASRYGLRAAHSSQAPTVSGSVGWFQTGTPFPPPTATVTAGVTVQWMPIDFGLRSGEVKQAQASLQSAEAALASSRLTIISDVSQAYLNLKTAEEKVVTAEAEVADARENLRLARGRWQAGLGIFTDVIDAQSALLTADTNRVNAISAIDQARAALAHAIGAALPTEPPPPSP